MHRCSFKALPRASNTMRRPRFEHERQTGLAMTTTPNLDRPWTRAEVADALRAQGIDLKSRADGYRLNFLKGGTSKTEYVTDDLIDALVTGLEMAEHPPPPPPKIRRKRWSPWRANYVLCANGVVRKRLKKRRRPAGKGRPRVPRP